MTDSYKSIADLSEEEKTYRLGLFDRFMKASEEKLKDNKKYQFGYRRGDVLQWKDFKDTYKDDIKENFLLFRHSGGEWEQYELEPDNYRFGGVDTAWRYVEGEYNPAELEQLIRDELEDAALKSKYNYEPGSSIPESDPYKIRRELAEYDDDKNLIPTSKIKKPSVSKFTIPESVRQYAAKAEGGKPKDTSRLAIQGLRTELQTPLTINSD
jgi:hypothetical protein